MTSNAKKALMLVACAALLITTTMAHAYTILASCSGGTSGYATCTLDMSQVSSKCNGTPVTVAYSNGATYPICIESINAAINDAQYVWAHKYASSNYTIDIDSGTYDLSAENSTNDPTTGVFNVNGINPPSPGMLTFTATTPTNVPVIITDNTLRTMYGNAISNIKFSYLRFQRGYPTTTFGTVTGGCSVAGQITITIPTGFPPVGSTTATSGSNGIYSGTTAGQMYLRAYDNSTPSNPVPLGDGTPNDGYNAQIPWGTTAPSGSGQVWTIYFNNSKLAVPSYYCNSNVVIAVKSKFDQDAYNFNNVGTGWATGTNVGFDHVIWQDEARGFVRNITNSFYTNVSVVQRPAISGQAWVLSMPAGGVQIGQPQDTSTSYTISGAVVSNYTATNTGDDSLAIFNDNNSATPASVSGATISNSFARDINLDSSCSVALSSLTISGCNVSLNDTPTYYNACVTDTSATECVPNYPL